MGSFFVILVKSEHQLIINLGKYESGTDIKKTGTLARF